MATKEVKIIKPTVANANNNLIRMAAYCRVSTDSADQVNSFMAQVAYYSDYIDSHDNMTLVDIYADEGITGTSVNKRTDFKRLIKDCQNRKIDRVIVKSVQRFARNSLESFPPFSERFTVPFSQFVHTALHCCIISPIFRTIFGPICSS